MRTRSMITTLDNPYDPFDEFDEWYAHDTRMGHHTSAFLARLVYNSDELSESDQIFVREQAIDEMVRYNVTGLYKKVTREVEE